jgi:DNA-binding NarL/FixJ family response regulator
MTDTGISNHASTERLVPPPAAHRVLVVEDDALVALGIRLTLVELGYEVVGIAASESEAVALASSERPDLALMDIRLRGPVDGVDTARRLRADLGIRSVYLSAYADEQTMARVAQTYPLGFVQKPYAASQLRAALDIAFRRLAQNTETSG